MTCLSVMTTMMEVVCTMKVSDQFKLINLRVPNNNHALLNKIIVSLSKKLKEDIGIELQYAGKEDDGSSVSVRVVGQVIAKDQEELDKIKNDARRVFDDLKNPSDFLSLLDE